MVQHKENDPNILYEQFRKRGAIDFHDTKDVMQADEWLEHINNVFGTIVCTQKQIVLLTSSMLRGVTNTWWKSVRGALMGTPTTDV